MSSPSLTSAIHSQQKRTDFAVFAMKFVDRSSDVMCYIQHKHTLVYRCTIASTYHRIEDIVTCILIASQRLVKHVSTVNMPQQ